jgi:hypothetical protein
MMLGVAQEWRTVEVSGGGRYATVTSEQISAVAKFAL